MTQPNYKFNTHTSKRLTLYREMYYFEQNRKYKIHSDASIIIGILIPIIAAANFFFYKLTSYIGKNFFFILLYILLLIGLFAFIVWALIAVIKTLYKYPYGYMPRANEMEQYFNNLVAVHKNKRQIIISEFDNFLLEKYIECVDLNIENNDTKLQYLIRTKRAIILSFIFVTFCSIFNALPLFIPCFK